ncbi:MULTISPECIES: colicin E3-like toxin immunity protein [unclassified Pseudomonas]|uniref:Colicin E3-like toxin immunity protein n=1 Tax=Pseudomonas sp. MYb327 TaxID=2745230 RepID=A0AAU8DXH0_9PSED
MGLKIRLDWFDKTTEVLEGKEYSADLGDDGSIIEAMGLMDANEIYDGGFNVVDAWIAKLQPLFNHQIDTTTFDYQIAFRYRQAW